MVAVFEVDGRVDKEKLDELLALGAEQEALDFKRTWTLTKGSKDNVSFVKDALAMASLPQGGYLIVGVEDNGSLATASDPIEPSGFDSASLTQKVRAFTGQSLPITSAVYGYAIDGGTHHVAIIHIPPPPGHLPLPLISDGEYKDDSGRRTIVFREGQIVVREGTSTAVLNHRHWPRLLTNYTEQVKADARKDIDALITALVANGAGAGRSTPLELDMSEETFASALSSADKYRVRAVLSQAVDFARVAIMQSPAETSPELKVPLDRIAAIAANAIFMHKPRQLRRAIDALRSIYDTPNPPSPYSVQLRAPEDVATATLWRLVITRVIALGALAVRVKAWNAVRSLALVPYEGSGGDYRYPSWIRHAVVYASRANVLADHGPLLSVARHYMAVHPSLRPDIATADTSLAFEALERASADPLLNSACQFDLFWCVAATLVLPDEPSVAMYPNFAAFNLERSEPAASALRYDAGARTAVTASASEDEVLQALEVVHSLAAQESVRLKLGR